MRHSRFILITVVLFLLPGMGQADWITKKVPTGRTPYALVVNPVTNKIYEANANDSTVTVIDGATNDTSKVAVVNPAALAVNPVTNKIYAANFNSGTVTVIDGPDLPPKYVPPSVLLFSCCYGYLGG